MCVESNARGKHTFVNCKARVVQRQRCVQRLGITGGAVTRKAAALAEPKESRGHFRGEEGKVFASQTRFHLCHHE